MLIVYPTVISYIAANRPWVIQVVGSIPLTVQKTAFSSASGNESWSNMTMTTPFPFHHDKFWGKYMMKGSDYQNKSDKALLFLGREPQKEKSTFVLASFLLPGKLCAAAAILSS